MPSVGKPDESKITPPPRPDPADAQERREKPLPTGGVIEGSMKTEEPAGWDQAPQAIDDPEKKRHPRPDGIGALVEPTDLKENDPLEPNDPT